MKKIYSLFLLSLLFLGLSNAVYAETYTFSFATSGTATFTNDGTKTLNDKDWTLATVWNSGTYYGSNTNGQQIGSNANPALSYALSSSDFSGMTITSVKVYANGYNTVPKLQISVGSSSNEEKNLSTTSSLHEWTGSSTGDIVISVTGGSGSPSTRALYIKSIEVTYSAAPDFAIIPIVNNSSLGSASVSGNVITAIPNTCVGYADPAYTVTSGTATVSQNGNQFTVIPSSDCSIQINFVALAASTVTLHPEGGSVEGDTELTQADCSSPVTLPEATAPCADWEFAGWATSVVAETTTAPELIEAGAYIPTENINLYAVYKKAGGMSTYTMAYDENTGWDVTNTDDKNTYFLLSTGKYILSPEIDLATITDITATIRTFGGATYNTLSVQDEDGNVYGTATATSTTLTEKSVTKGTGLTGIGKLKILSTTTTTAYGVGISEVTVTAGSNTFNSNPVCEDPIIEAPEIEGGQLDLGVIQPNAADATKTFNVSGSNLTAGMTLEITGTDAAQFDVDPKTISLPAPTPVAPRVPAAEVGETPVTVTYTPSASDATHTAILTISSAGAESMVINLKGETKAVVGIDGNENDGLIVSTEGNNIVVKTKEVAPVVLYSVSGKLISTHKVVNGQVTIPAAQGAYIVKVGDKIAKVVL